MNTLRIGSSGELVRSLQLWYANFEPIPVDGNFDAATEAATKRVQQRLGLNDDGVVGPLTAGRFMTEGWLPPGFDQPTDESSAFPPAPAHYKALTQVQKVELFGRPGSAPPEPTPGGPIQPDPAFAKNIVRLNLHDWFPHLTGVTNLDLHKGTQATWRALFDAIVARGLGDRLLTCAGSWNPRFIRGSTSIFSSHSFATAVDFNAPQNALGAQPAKRGKPGSLVEIVELLPEFQLWWGGWFGRVDGMHLECTKVD